MVDEIRLQRMEDKIDKISEMIIETRLMKQELLYVTKWQQEHEAEGKDRDTEVLVLKKELSKLHDRLQLVIKVVALVLMVGIGAATGINIL